MIEGTPAALLHHSFESVARRWPERTALDIPPGNGRPRRTLVTYAELDRQSNAVARVLRAFVDAECVVALLLPRNSPQLYASQLGVLKAGAAFTSLDPASPDGRIRHILQDSGAGVVLTDSQHTARAAGVGNGSQRILNVADAIDRAQPIEPSPPQWLTPESLAYVIYTSGTTGVPKGVMIEHRSIANLVAADLEEFGLSPDARVGQSSSPAYDSFLEETWLAFAAGATVVVLDDDTTRLGPDLIPWLRRERIQVLCPPPTLLRATGCVDPEAQLPDLSLLYVGGEALPADLADRWSRNRRLVNGYGPTECTVTALSGDVHEGGPVTIGRPVPGMRAWVLDDHLDEAPAGHWGELCLGGIGLARGYWNRPDLTAEKFVVHPRFGRIYRTGDLVHRDSDGSYSYHGRIDSQVKIRGHRVELEEIEAQLSGCPGVRAAACRLQDDGGRETLAGFLVPADAQAPPSFDAVRSRLREILPSHAVPGRFGLLSELPLSAGGKLDRKKLPRLDGQPVETNAPPVAPRDEKEALLALAVQEILGWQSPVSIHDDFFSNLGGDSLSAARLVSKLREDASWPSIAVRDVYEARTVAELASRMRASSPAQAEVRPPEQQAGGSPLLATLVQTLWLVATFSVAATAAYLLVFDLLPLLTDDLGPVLLIVLGPWLFFAALALYTPLAVFAAVLVKRRLIGRYRSMRAPVWGSFYVRNWIVRQVVGLVPWWLLEGTEFRIMALRALGARIGRRVHIHRGVDLLGGGWDLLEIGDDVAISQDASVRLVELDDGQIVVGPVSLGDGATLETRAGVAGNTRLGEGACLTALSSLPAGGAIPAGELWDGIPARPAGPAPPTPSVTGSGHIFSPVVHGLLLILARYAVVLLSALPMALVAAVALAANGLDAGRILNWLFRSSEEPAPLLWVLVLALLSVPLTLVAQALILRMLGRMPEGVISRWSASYIRLWLKTGIVLSASDWLSGSLLWPVWLRWAGMKVGRGCEISTIIDIVPELTEIGDGCFFADGNYPGGLRHYRGTVTLATTRFGDDTFLGNHAVVPAGRRLPENVLIGISTVAGDQAMRPGSSWFGHPPFELPRREVVEFDRRLTYEPSRIRYLNRLSWELARFKLPIVPAALVLIWLKVLVAAEAVATGPIFYCAVVPLAGFGAAAALCLLVLIVKWVLIGRVRPGRHALWSCWCSRWDYLYVVWARYAHGPLTALEGTLLLSWFLRAMGMEIGRRVVLGPGFAQVVDPDMLRIDDGATVTTMFQAHTFEDRVLKIDRIHIGRRATLGAASVPLYGADVGEGAYVAPHSVIMKQEHLLPGRRYEGAPARQD